MLSTKIESIFANLLLMGALFSLGCSPKSSTDSPSAGQSYSFTATANSRLGTDSSFLHPFGVSLRPLSASGPTLCSSVICITPTSISGKYFGTGLSIQSNGSGMMAYFGQSIWSDITGTSPSYSFDSASPIVNAGTLNCCVGTGDLTSENTYLAGVSYLFGYLDVAFTLSGITGNVSMNGNYDVRFVLATGAMTNAIRGDILLNEGSGYQWMDSTNGSLVSTRPSSPVTMDSSVVNWVNPFGTDKGNQEIPVISANIIPPVGGGVRTITETELKTESLTYSFGFNMANFVVFPSLLHADINLLSSKQELLTRLHLAGLPHSDQPMGVGDPADTEITINP